MSIAVDNREEFADFLNRELEDRNWSQAELARRIDRPRQTISNYAMGKVLNPDENVLRDIARTFGYPPETVFRAAGLLPPKPQSEVTLEEWHYLLEQLTDQDREELKAIALMKIERQQQQQTARRRPVESTP